MKACTICGKLFTRNANLKLHMLNEHRENQTGAGKRKTEGSEEGSPKRSKHSPEKLERQNAIPVTRFVDSRNYTPTLVYDFKFKHPFCMMVAGPSRSGKTHWVAKLIKKRHDMIDSPVTNVIYYYAHWQQTYDEIKDQNVLFHRGLPSEEELGE